MTETKGETNPLPKPDVGGTHYRSEIHSGEPNLDSWLHIRDTLIAARDQRAMKRATIIAGNQRIILPINEALEFYERLIRDAGAGHLLEPKKEE